MARLRQGREGVTHAADSGQQRRRRSVAIGVIAILAAALSTGPAQAADFSNSAAGQKAKPAKAGGEPVKPRPKADASLAGGWYPPATMWPWVTAISYSDRTFTGDALARANCTATLISPTRVLTAAHCVDVANSDGTKAQPATNFMVHVGRRDRKNTSQGYSAYVTGIALHPKAYLPEKDGDLHQNHAFYDIAVLFLDRSIPVTPAPIGTPEDWCEWCYVTSMGFGHWNYDHTNPQYDGVLRAADFQLPPDSFCEYYFHKGTPAGTSHWYPNIHVCATHQAGRADCITHGDSGGPLMININNAGWKLIGVTSFYPQSNDSGVGCGVGGPFGWAWVASKEMRDWPLTVAHPPVTNNGGGGSGGNTQTPIKLNMSAGQARRYVKKMIKAETNGRIKRLKTRCSRNDYRSFNCAPRFKIGRKSLKARGMVWHFQQGNNAFYTWEFKGKRYGGGRVKKFTWS